VNSLQWRSQPSRSSLLWMICLVLLALSSGCRRDSAQTSSDLDEATVAVLNTVRALHHQADVYEDAGDYPQAASAIERVLALRIPAGILEAEDIRVDAWGRLAEIALAQGEADRAMSHANTGLRDAQRESVLTARLHVVRGRALRALAEQARQAGDTTLAEERSRQAIESLETSIRINQRVLGTLLDGGRGP
jgi:tetratricopeptide (TPR) repeat protein